MTAPTAGNKGSNTGSSGRRHYDKELVRKRTLDLLARRLGPGKDQGSRLVWNCPECGKREKYSVKRAEGKGGCLVEGCRLGGYDDVFGMIAKLEGLDYHADFIAVLRRAYDLLSLDPPGEEPRSRGKSPSAEASGARAASKAPQPRHRNGPVSRRPRASAGDASTDASSLDGGPGDPAEILEFASRVYERILELCSLESRDRGYLRTRGLSNETIKQGRFATMTAPRARQVKAVLQREFGRERLLSVPGFSEDDENGRLKFTLTGEYILIPYHDARGRVTTIEGRSIGEPSGGVGKYVSLRGSGNHLYLFPGYKPEDLLAVCEGAMGAIVAAEFGLTVGAIQGCERFRASPSPEMLDGEPGDPLLELKGADFGGRTVPYIPDADDPPNPNVLKAAPKAARWIAEPQNGRAAVCLLPKGADFDEWLLSLDAAERGARFADLLAAANPPEDGEGPAAVAPTPRGSGPEAVPVLSAPEKARQDLPRAEPPARDGTQSAAGAAPRNGVAQPRPPEDQQDPRPQPANEDGIAGAPTPQDARRDGAGGGGGQVLTTPGDETPRKRKGGGKPKGAARGATGSQADGSGSPGPQPGLWDDVVAEDGGEGDGGSGRRAASRGARKVRDEVYRAMMEALPIKEAHLEALEKTGVMRATARVGGFASIDERSVRKVAAHLTERFGARKLLSVPGFEADGASTGKVRFSLASSEAAEHLVIPCSDAEGLLSGVEGLAFDPKTGELDAEQTVPLSGAGGHLYVFAHYPPAQIEGFCEGPIGAMLAAQNDVVIGAIGGFRRYKAASGPGEGRQPLGAVLPELEGVHFAGRQIAYCPCAGAGVSENNARYHEAPVAVRWLVERQNGSAAIVSLGGEQPVEDGAGAEEGSPDAEGRRGPSSLAEWILTHPEDEAQERLRELFPESPLREQQAEEQGAEQLQGTQEEADGDGTPPPPPSGAAYGALAVAAFIGAFLDQLVLRLEAFAGYVSPGLGGEQLLYAGTLGPLRRLADSDPFHLLYDLHVAVASAVAFGLAFALMARVRRAHLARWRAARMRLEDRWELHLTQGRKPPSRAPITAGEVLAAALAWPLVYALSGWIISATQWGLSLAASLQMAPEVGPLVQDPQRASIYAATVAAAFVLWRRRAIRGAEVRMLQGKIRH